MLNFILRELRNFISGCSAVGSAGGLGPSGRRFDQGIFHRRENQCWCHVTIVVTVLSVVFSGVVATVITILYQKFSGEQTAKRRVFETAVSYRFFISEEENVKSLNSIDVIFHKNQQVRQAWKSYMDEADKPSSNPQQLNDRYIKLLEEMALACGYKDIRWDDLKRYYYPNGLLNRKNDDEVLKKLQIKAAEKTASDAVGQQNTPQNEQFANQMMLQLLPKLIENPDSFSKLIELADKAKK